MSDLPAPFKILALDGGGIRGLFSAAVISHLEEHSRARLVDHFESLQRLLAANIEDLMAVEGVGESRARAVREGLSRMAETSILERYV